MTLQRKALVPLALALTLLSMCGFPSAGEPNTSEASSKASFAASCRHIDGPFHTRGAAVFNASGQRYVPYGINIIGLAHPLYQRTLSRDLAQITATAEDWCGNTVRIQVSQNELIDGEGHRATDLEINPVHLDALRTEVEHARGLGLVVVIALETTNDDDYETTEYMPTTRSVEAWRAIVSAFGSDPDVAFDLFNEPDQVGTWARWRNGFWSRGVRYYGFQELAAKIRAMGAKNLMWVEGPLRGSILSEAWKYRLRGVGPLMYAEHRPPRPNTKAVWSRTFGYLGERDLAPIVAGEWAQYARSDAPWACWENAPTEVPRWLGYLRARRIGMIAHKLTEGVLVQSEALDDPTRLKADWRCVDGLNQGAGKLINDWFDRQNGPVSETREGSGTVNLMVTRTGSTGSPATLRYARSSGTATPGKDFKLPGDTVTFAADQVTAAIPIRIVDDAAAEGRETILVTLAAGAGTTVASPRSMTVTISTSD